MTLLRGRVSLCWDWPYRPHAQSGTCSICVVSSSTRQQSAWFSAMGSFLSFFCLKCPRSLCEASSTTKHQPGGPFPEHVQHISLLGPLGKCYRNLAPPGSERHSCALCGMHKVIDYFVREGHELCVLLCKKLPRGALRKFSCILRPLNWTHALNLRYFSCFARNSCVHSSFAIDSFPDMDAGAMEDFYFQKVCASRVDTQRHRHWR